MSLDRTVDVLIPVYEPDEDFKKLLKMLSRQTVRPRKIILMVTEGRREVAPDDKAYPDIEIHKLRKRISTMQAPGMMRQRIPTRI